MEKIAVIGAGVMGAGIAAQIANAGLKVLLLDRPGIAASAMARMRAHPAPFMSPAATDLVEPADSDSELGRIAECDWIIEVVVERLDVKQALYRRIDAARRPEAAVSSNTSTFPLARLIEGMPDGFRRSFLVTHFFNPPRTMRLLELVTGPDSDPALVARVRNVCDVSLGKTPVDCHDSPGFIANRIGAYWLQLGVNAARDLGLSVEESDAAMGRPAGIPKTGVFGLLDLIGLDVMAHIVASLSAALPASDPLQATLHDWPLLTRLIETGFTGRKGQGGFYRIDRAGGGKGRQALDLVTADYRPERPAEVAARDLPALLATDGPIGEYARRVLGGTLGYAASLVPEAADNIVAIDSAMRLGYAWKRGPFQMIDAIGAEAFAHLAAETPPLLAQRRAFYRTENGRLQHLGRDGYSDVPSPPGILLLSDVSARSKPVLRNGSASLWDVGDGVACFELTSKMGSFDTAILDLLRQTIEVVAGGFAALVIGHDGEHFSAGANLANILAAARLGHWNEIGDLTRVGQGAFKALKYAPFPVVAAPFGLVLGGGCEIVLHADAVQAHAESTIGLVECGVGLIPGWGGCGEMLERLPGETAFAQIQSAATSSSAADAKALKLLHSKDGITMNRDRVLADAKARALAMVAGHRPKSPPAFRLPGPAGRDAMMRDVQDLFRQGRATQHDVTVATALATVLSGGDTDPTRAVSETDLLALERREFVELMRHPATQARIEHTLATGKRLRN